MAPIPSNDVAPLKRNSTTANFDAPAAKKQNRGSVRHHRPFGPPTQDIRDQTAPQHGEVVDAVLERSIVLALEAVGFAGADPRALQAFRLEVEEYMHHFLGDVRQSMLGSKRVQPTPADFLQSLHTHQLLLSSLLPHLNPPVTGDKSMVVLRPESAEPEEQDQHVSNLLLGNPNEARSYIPSHFPPFPSQHTYKATPNLPSVERDPRKVRELAAQNARLGEAALRKLVGAGSDIKLSTNAPTGKEVRSLRARRDDVWKEAMQTVTPALSIEPADSDDMQGLEGRGASNRNKASPSGYLSTSVNAGKQYWRRVGKRQISKPPANNPE
ncbi:MAG: hypothetical protein Q9195_006632 [Heterodermia aff. obscurata]